jgi:hypothetical protein
MITLPQQSKSRKISKILKSYKIRMKKQPNIRVTNGKLMKRPFMKYN